MAIDLYCGLGGWAEGLLAAGYRVVGFDIERHDYGTGGYPGQLVLQDVTTLHGSQFRNVSLIVASPPCQAYSYRAMPWSRAKALPPPDNTLFDACFRIQREACEAAGRYIPMVVENVRGAQKWVGRAKWHFGSYYLWGDVPALMPITLQRVMKPGITHRDDGSTNFHHQKDNPGSCKRLPGAQDGRISGWPHAEEGTKQSMGGSWYGDYEAHKARAENHIKEGGDWFGKNCETSTSRMYSSKSKKRKAASAMIAKIPFALSFHIGQVYAEGKES